MIHICRVGLLFIIGAIRDMTSHRAGWPHNIMIVHAKPARYSCMSRHRHGNMEDFQDMAAVWGEVGPSHQAEGKGAYTLYSVQVAPRC